MTRQVGSEPGSLGQHRTQLALEALHQLVSLLLEFSITAAAVAEIADGDAIDELADRHADAPPPARNEARPRA